MKAGDLFSSNIAMLSRSGQGGLASRLSYLKPDRYRLSGTLEAGTLTLTRRDSGAPVFPGDALTDAFHRMQAFRKTPTRHLIAPLRPARESDLVAENLIRDIYDQMGEMTINAAPTADAGAFVILGLGLGICAPLALQHFMTKDLVLYEPDMELLYWAMHTVSLHGLEDTVRSRGGTLSILTDTDPSNAAAAIIYTLRGGNGPLIDGSYFMRGRDGGDLDPVWAELRQRSRHLETSSGFFEDEVTMFRNTAANLARHDWRVLEDDPGRAIRTTPAIFVGSGPSVDDAIPQIRALSGRAIIFSGGSSLRVLLENGIVPDFYCAIENIEEQRDIVAAAAERFPLDGIALIGANTIDPGIAGYFSERLLFYRAATTGTRVLGPDRKPLFLADPGVVNTGLRAAIALGLRDLYLFGVDLGAPSADVHHSKSSDYVLNEDPNWQSAWDMEPLTIPADGNFGGRILTNASFQLGQMFLERLIAACPQARFHNCSDGLRIAGAVPLKPEQVAPASPLIDRPHLREALVGGLPFRSQGLGQADRQRIEAYGRAISDWFAAARTCIAERRKTDVYRLYDALKPLLQAPGMESDHSVEAAARFCMSGSVQRMMMLCHYLYRRLDPGDRADFLDFFCARLLVYIDRMEETARTMCSTALKMPEHGRDDRGAG